ncbi:MAG: hypothetical protein FWG99_01820 [Treponema sp.]|nr:hypothetical protein [Treponema sp.]
MKKNTILFLWFLTAAASIYAQIREDTLIHVPDVAAERPDHAIYFRENFEMEIAGAGYTITDSETEADYIIQLEVKPNVILYDDGTFGDAPPDEDQYLLHIALYSAEDSAEIVAFTFPFTELEEMYSFNLYLVYEAMANVPITRLADVEIAEEDDNWRNKWLYLRVSLDYPVISAYIIKESVKSERPGYDPIYQGNEIGVFVGATAGLELQFLDWMSAEAFFNIRFSDPVDEFAFIPGIGLQLKFPLKPAKHFMLSPYLVCNTQAPTAGNYVDFPQWAVGGGFQFGAKGGSTGAFFIDANYLYSIGDVVIRNRSGWSPERIHYTRNVISIGLGYKIGFFDRPK